MNSAQKSPEYWAKKVAGAVAGRRSSKDALRARIEEAVSNLHGLNSLEFAVKVRIAAEKQMRRRLILGVIGAVLLIMVMGAGIIWCLVPLLQGGRLEVPIPLPTSSPTRPVAIPTVLPVASPTPAGSWSSQTAVTVTGIISAATCPFPLALAYDSQQIGAIGNISLTQSMVSVTDVLSGALSITLTFPITLTYYGSQQITMSGDITPTQGLTVTISGTCPFVLDVPITLISASEGYGGR